MTNKEDREKIKQILIKLSRNKRYIINMSRSTDPLQIKIKNLVINTTDYLDSSCRLTERMFHILNDLFELPKCPGCGKTLIFPNRDTKYRTFCSTKCAKNCDEVNQKMRQTNLKRFGTEYASQNKNIKEKVKQTNLKRHGVTAPLKSEIFKQKVKQTNLEKYGVDSPQKCKEIQEKTRQTNLERYGVEYAVQSEQALEKTKQTNLKRFGVEHSLQAEEVKEKIKQTCLEKHGVEVITQSEFFKEKSKQTNLERYGTEHASQSEIIKEKTRQHNLKKYGVESPSQLDIIKERIRKTNIEKYGTESPMQNVEVTEKMKATTLATSFQKILTNERILKHYTPDFTLGEYSGVKNQWYSWICKKCNTKFNHTIQNGRLPRCPKCYPSNKSNGQQQILEFCKSRYSDDILVNDRSIIGPKELDIYLKNINLAIEFNGIFWHTELNGKDKYYHQNKTIECLQKNINLVQIFEDEWIDKSEIVKSILLNKFGMIENRIAARKCKIYPIKDEYARQFLDNNHIQGTINGIHFGLSFKNELVSIITIGKPRFDRKYDLEIYRFCSKLNTVVIGGLGKLIKHVRKIYVNQTIVTYADLRYGTGHGYKKVGFLPIRITDPGYFYYKKSIRYSRQQFQKHKLKEKLELFDPNLTEWENMQLNGYDRIWDCGNAVYILS